MPSLIAPLVGFVLGAAFAWAAAEELVRSHAAAHASRAFLVVGAFAVLVFAPAAGYFAAFHADWAWAYLADARRVPPAADFAIALLDAAAVPLGFLAASPHARRRRLTGVLRVAAGPAVAAAVFVVAVAPRLAVCGTYAQFAGQFGTRPIAGSALGWGVLWVDGVLAFAVGWTFWSVKRIGRARA